MKTLLVVTLLLLLAAPLSPQSPAPDATAPWARRYHDGETLRYVMNGVNQGVRYRVHAIARVTRDQAGGYIEQFEWSDLQTDGAAVELPRATRDFRQVVSLAPEHINAVPRLNGLEPRLVGPITDLVAFYSDLWLAARMSGGLRSPGDRVAYAYGKPASWADGTFILVGEDAVDFEVSLASIDRAHDVATIEVRHVPPQAPHIVLPATWMTAHVADTANNWIEVRKQRDGSYDAEVGKETFDTRLTVSLSDGRIVKARMDNPVEAVRRVCTDTALTACGAAVRVHIQRTIALDLEP